MSNGNMGYSSPARYSAENYRSNEELGICEMTPGVQNSSQQGALKSENERASEGIRNLGEVESLSAATNIIGNVIDTLVPRSGDKARVEFNMNIPIHPSNTVFFSLRLTGEAERDAQNRVKLRNEIQLGVMGRVEIDAWIVSIEAHLRVAGIGYIESVGSSGAEAFNFMGLALRESVAEYSEQGAEFLIGGADRDALFRRMGAGEYAEAGLGIEASAGIGVSDANGTDAAGVTYRDTVATRYTSQEGSAHAQETNVRTQELQISGSTTGRPAVGIDGSVKYQTIGSGYEIEAGISGNARFSAQELDAIFVSTTWVSGIMTTFATLITGGINRFGGSQGQRVGQMASLIRDTSVSGIVLSHYAHDALNRLKGFNGLNIGHKVSVKGTYRNGTLGGTFSLERFSEIQYGDGPTDTVNLLLQNIDPVVSIDF